VTSGVSWTVIGGGQVARSATRDAPRRGAVRNSAAVTGSASSSARTTLDPDPERPFSSAPATFARPARGGNQRLPQGLHVLRLMSSTSVASSTTRAGLRRSRPEDPKRVGIVLRVPLPAPTTFHIRHCLGGDPRRGRAPAPPRWVSWLSSTGPPVASSTPSSRIAVAGAGPAAGRARPPPNRFPRRRASVHCFDSELLEPLDRTTMSSTASTARLVQVHLLGRDPVHVALASRQVGTRVPRAPSPNRTLVLARPVAPALPRAVVRLLGDREPLLQPTPHRTAFRTVTATPSSPNRAGNASKPVLRHAEGKDAPQGHVAGDAGQRGPAGSRCAYVSSDGNITG